MANTGSMPLSKVAPNDVISSTSEVDSQLMFHPGNQAFSVAVLRHGSMLPLASPVDYAAAAMKVVEEVHNANGRFVYIDPTTAKTFNMQVSPMCVLLPLKHAVSKVGACLAAVHKERIMHARANSVETSSYSSPTKPNPTHASSPRPIKQPPPPPPRTAVRPPPPVFGPSISQMARAIPKDASSIFSIFDRKVNLDSFSKDASMYSLLRAWVKDDPRRVAPKGGADLVEYETVPVDDLKELEKPSNTSSTNSTETCDVLGKLTSGEAKQPSIEELRKSLIKKAKKIKHRAKLYDKRQDEIIVERLRARGIHLHAA